MALKSKRPKSTKKGGTKPKSTPKARPAPKRKPSLPSTVAPSPLPPVVPVTVTDGVVGVVPPNSPFK